MSVKILIERSARAGFEDMVEDMLRNLRAEAVRARGYLYSETWREVADTRVFLVLSVWASLAHWQTWAENPFRVVMEERLSQVCRRPSKVRIFTDAIEPAPALVPAKPAQGRALRKRANKQAG